VLGYKGPVPAQQGCRLDEEVPETPASEQSCDSRRHRSICRLERWSLHLASKHRHLVAQHDDLDGEIGVTATDQSDEPKEMAERAVEEREGHRPMLTGTDTPPQSAGHGPWVTISAPTGENDHFVNPRAWGPVAACLPLSVPGSACGLITVHAATSGSGSRRVSQQGDLC
jgi:hypothetical protein